MNRQHRNLLSALIGLGIAAIPASPVLGQQPPADFFTIRDVPLPGDSRFDYESLDSQSHRLYVTATGSNQVAVIEPQTLSVIATIPGGVYPDGLVYDPDLGKLYVSDETGGTDTVIDTTSNQVVATVPPGGEVGNTQYDPVSHQILVAVQTRNQLVTIDAQTDQVSGRYDTPGCDHPHGLQISPDRRMAFVACEANAKLVVMDLQTMSITESHDVGTVPDVLAFDAPAVCYLWRPKMGRSPRCPRRTMACGRSRSATSDQTRMLSRWTPRQGMRMCPWRTSVASQCCASSLCLPRANVATKIDT